MRRLLIALLLLGVQAVAGLERYPEYVKADPPDARASRSGKGVRITYLGTNGYLLQAPGCTLLVDPYFTRQSAFRVALNFPVRSDPALVREMLGRGGVPRHVDAILVTHAHIDHLLDAPTVLRETDGCSRLLASQTGVELVSAVHGNAPRQDGVRWGETFHAGSARITVLPATHDRMLGFVPFPGERLRKPRPILAADWKCGLPLAFLIEVNGRRIYIDSGGRADGIVPDIGPVDLAIIGVALPDSRRRLPRALAGLRPRYFLPSHQDNFFRPLRNGFVFGPLTDFPQVRRLAAQTPARLVLLDYFTPWTLP